MHKIFAQIRHDGGIRNAHAEVLPVEEIFRLQDMDAVKAAEKKFLR